MEHVTTLRGQALQNQVREVGINPNHWYPVAWAAQLQPGEVTGVTVWQEAIALYRDHQGHLHALEDACPHKGVALRKGSVEGETLACPYHGWQFNGAGNCVHIPYLPATQKLPCAQARSYPVLEKYGIIWLFPGEPSDAQDSAPPCVPEYDRPEYFLVRIPGHFQAHFSICNENTMDVFHGHLHRDLQGWFDPVLLNLRQGDGEVWADYQVSYRGPLTRILGLGKGNHGVTTRTVSIHYQYPHYHTTLEDVSSLYLMRLPIGPTETRSFSLLFLKLPIPRWFTQGFLRRPLERLFLNQVFLKFLHQDVEMVESEQHTYVANPNRHYVEVNPAIIALQRVIFGQYEQFVQQSRESLCHVDGRHSASVHMTEALGAK